MTCSQMATQSTNAMNQLDASTSKHMGDSQEHSEGMVHCNHRRSVPSTKIDNSKQAQRIEPVVESMNELERFIATFDTNQAANPQKLKDGLSDCRRIYKNLHAKMSSAKSVGKKRKWETLLNKLITIRTLLSEQYKVGSGIIPRKARQSERVSWEDGKSAFQKRVQTGIITNLKHSDPMNFLADCCSVFKRKFDSLRQNHFALKINATFCGKFIINKCDMVEEEDKYIQTENAIIYRDDVLKDLSGTVLAEWFNDNVTNKILRELDEFQEKGSGWALKSIVNLALNINKFTPQSQLGKIE